MVKGQQDFWTYLYDHEYLTFDYTVRYSKYDPEKLPSKLQSIRKRLRYDKMESEDKFIVTMMVIGIYPSLYFLPIKKYSVSNVYPNGTPYTEIEYKVTNYNDYFSARNCYDENKNSEKIIKNLKKQGIEIMEYRNQYNDCYIDLSKWDSKSWQCINSCIPSHNHIWYPMILEESGIEFDYYFNCFKFDYPEIFKDPSINCPIFATDLNFTDYRCNTKLSVISMNTSIDRRYNYKLDKRVCNRVDYIDFIIPIQFYDRIQIADCVLDWQTSANENEIKRTDNEIRDSHGFNKDSFIGSYQPGKRK